MQLRWISATGVSEHPVDAVAELLTRPDGLVWLDIPTWDEAAERVLRDVFAFHPLAISDCAQRNQVPKVHVYADHVFLVLHAPHAGAAGHVHTIELDQFIGDRYLVTVHGPLSPAADPAAARIEVDALAKRLEQAAPSSARLRSHVRARVGCGQAAARLHRPATADMWDLEYRFQAVVKEGPSGHLRDPERSWTSCSARATASCMARTQAATSREVFARMYKIKAFGPGRGQKRIDDAVDQFAHLCAVADGQKENLQGTIEFYQARTNTKVTIAAERLAVIAAITLPVTAVSSILGMNVIVNDKTQPLELAVAVASMAVMSVLLLIWARRQGWL